MIITWHTPEDRYSTASWAVPLFCGSGTIQKAIFVPNCVIDPEKAAVALAFRNGDNFLGELVVNHKISAFRAMEFSFWARKFEGCLELIKRPVQGKSIALPLSLIQVEII